MAISNILQQEWNNERLGDIQDALQALLNQMVADIGGVKAKKVADINMSTEGTDLTVTVTFSDETEASATVDIQDALNAADIAVDIVNNLRTDIPTKALSAAMGMELNRKACVLLEHMHLAADTMLTDSDLELNEQRLFFAPTLNRIYAFDCHAIGSGLVNREVTRDVYPPRFGVVYIDKETSTCWRWDGTNMVLAVHPPYFMIADSSSSSTIENYNPLVITGDVYPRLVWFSALSKLVYLYMDGQTRRYVAFDPDPNRVYVRLGASPKVVQWSGNAWVDVIDISSKANAADVVGKLSQSDISVETQGDGTVDINVGSGANKDTYTINLNHTHENMAKLIVCEESDLPSTLDNSTIYAITDSGETEIEKLIIRGMEFAGGGIPDTGEPMISSPSNGSTINLGTNEGSGVSKTITVKGKNLTGDLTVAVGTGLTISYGQALDASRVTIPMAQALLGAQVTIAYSGSGALDDGSLVISHGGSVLSSVVVVVVPAPVEITAVKFTGSQWLETDYYPNPNTEFELDCQFVANSHTTQSGITPNGPCPYFLSCENEGNNRFNFLVGSHENTNTNAYRICCNNNTNNTRCVITAFQALANQGGMLVRSKLEYKKAASNMSMTFNNASSSDTVPFKTNTMLSKLAIGYSYYFADEFNTFDLIIYGFKIMENGVTIKDYRPALYNGVPGLYDYENDDFISSKTSTELVAITN